MMDRATRILFVDFDGCLTCKADGSYFNPDPRAYHASDRILTYLKSFCKKNDVKVVLTSNWRKFDLDGTWTNPYGTFTNPLPKLIQDLGDICVGTLPPERHVRKSEALILWFEDNGPLAHYAIFDDDLRENYQYTAEYGIKDHFILCDVESGITHKNLTQAFDIINRKGK